MTIYNLPTNISTQSSDDQFIEEASYYEEEPIA
jgi:hypothetical protein